MRKTVIGVMGPGASARKEDITNAFELGKLIAGEQWILLSGGRNEGVMDASCRGAQAAGGIVVGVIPGGDNSCTSTAVDIAMLTDMGSARNNINVLSSDVVIACGMGSGTASEVALALKSKKDVILISNNQQSKDFFKSLDCQHVHIAETVAEAIEICSGIIKLDLSSKMS